MLHDAWLVRKAGLNPLAVQEELYTASSGWLGIVDAAAYMQHYVCT